MLTHRHYSSFTKKASPLNLLVALGTTEMVSVGQMVGWVLFLPNKLLQGKTIRPCGYKQSLLIACYLHRLDKRFLVIIHIMSEGDVVKSLDRSFPLRMTFM